MMTRQALKEIPPMDWGGLDLVDAEMNVFSIHREGIPDWVRAQFLADMPYEDIKHLTFFYHPGADAVVLNRSHENADFYELLVTAYLGTIDEERQRLKEQVPVDIIGTALNLLDSVLEERRRDGRYQA